MIQSLCLFHEISQFLGETWNIVHSRNEKKRVN